MLEKPILPHDVMSISIVEELVNWLQMRDNRNISKYKVCSTDENQKVVPSTNAWLFQLSYDEGDNNYKVLSISLKDGIKLNSFLQEESQLALKALKLAYKLEKGDIASANIIQNYFN